MQELGGSARAPHRFLAAFVVLGGGMEAMGRSCAEKILRTHFLLGQMFKKKYDQTNRGKKLRDGFLWLQKSSVGVNGIQIPSPKLTAKAPENRPFAPKGKASSSNHPFPGAFAVIFREGKLVVLTQLKNITLW